MKQYIRVYRKLVDLNISSLVVYRANFMNNAISSVAWAIFVIYVMVLLTSQVQEAYGWSRSEILLLAGIHTVVTGVLYTFFGRNFNGFSNIVHFGELDMFLTKPIDVQFMTTVRIINFTHIFRILIGIV